MCVPKNQYCSQEKLKIGSFLDPACNFRVSILAGKRMKMQGDRKGLPYTSGSTKM